MVENSRIPIDDPKTHLELTMIHEVMILDYSGFDKALIHIGTYLKFALYGSLIYNLIVPAGWNIFLQGWTVLRGPGFLRTSHWDYRIIQGAQQDEQEPEIHTYLIGYAHG